MKLLERKLSTGLKYECTWLADSESEVTADFAPECAEGSAILCIGTGSVFVKNTKGKWQKYGTEEVVE